MIAFEIPFALVLLLLVKKLTVMGTIGNTHGVNNAASPPKKPAIKILHQLLLSPVSISDAAISGDATHGLVPAIVNLKSTIDGGRHWTSLQIINSISPCMSIGLSV